MTAQFFANLAFYLAAALWILVPVVLWHQTITLRDRHE
jgi:hypothetical protein